MGAFIKLFSFTPKSCDYVWNPQRGNFSDKQLKRYREDDNGDLYTCQDLTAERRNSNSGKFNWRGTFPSERRGWGYERDQLEKWWAEGRIATKRDGTPRQERIDRLPQRYRRPDAAINLVGHSRIANTSAERLDYRRRSRKRFSSASSEHPRTRRLGARLLAWIGNGPWGW